MTRIRLWLLALTAVLTMTVGSGIRNAHAYTSFAGSASSGAFSISYFYDELDPYGQWIDYGDYGTCWVPAHVAYGWRPYMRGHWIYTDYGWTWASYEPFGWATYHYGRWVLDPYYGWVWVPGTVWAPAWVAWRESDECVGWAPLPPQVGWSVSVGLTYGSYSSSSIAYDRWCFVDRRRFISNDASAVVFAASRNANLWRTSRDATRFRVSGGAPINEGVAVASMERSVGQRIPRMRVRAVDAPDRGQGRQIDAGTVGFFRPSIRGTRDDFNRATEGRAQPQRADNRFERQAEERVQRADRIQRDREQVRNNPRNPWRDVNENRSVERVPQVRTERPGGEFGGQRREIQRPERGVERQAAPEQREIRSAPREQRGQGSQEVRSRERGNRESSNDSRERGRGKGKGNKKDGNDEG